MTRVGDYSLRRFEDFPSSYAFQTFERMLVDHCHSGFFSIRLCTIKEEIDAHADDLWKCVLKCNVNLVPIAQFPLGQVPSAEKIRNKNIDLLLYPYKYQ